jgi:hypothetical protein
MNQHEEEQRGRSAREVIESPLFREAFDKLRAGIVDKWRACPVRDLEGQHELKLMDKLLADVEKYLKDIIDTGKMAEIQIERDAKIAQLRKAGIR